MSSGRPSVKAGGGLHVDVGDLEAAVATTDDLEVIVETFHDAESVRLPGDRE